MKNQLLGNKEFNIISRSIDNACKCNVISVSSDCFKVKLNKKVKFEPEESVELFTMTQKGQLYFETIIKSVDNDTLSIWFPISYKYLQRREYSRVNHNKEIILKNGKNKITAQIEDLSAGGLKISTQEELHLLKDYKTTVEVENKLIKTIFQPIRTEFIQNKYISSGRFKEISNYDRIALVQYCLKKQIENNNM